jgi:hypothetical protein
MGMRPPSDDSDEPDSIEFGIAALDAHLDGADITYPADVSAVERAVGDHQVAYDASGNTLRVADALAELDREEPFEDEQALLNALHPVFEAKRRQAKGSVVQQVRSLLPF